MNTVSRFAVAKRWKRLIISVLGGALITALPLVFRNTELEQSILLLAPGMLFSILVYGGNLFHGGGPNFLLTLVLNAAFYAISIYVLLWLASRSNMADRSALKALLLTCVIASLIAVMVVLYMFLGVGAVSGPIIIVVVYLILRKRKLWR